MVQAFPCVEKIQVASRYKQQEILDLCRDTSAVTALGLSQGREHFIIIESSDLFWQSAVELLIAELDPSARLLPASSGVNSTSDISEVALTALSARRVS